jgi:hypothetical protein
MDGWKATHYTNKENDKWWTAFDDGT